MLGMVFTEFIEMVEERFSPEMADRVVAAAPGERDGVYTAVGYYPHEELVAMVVELSRLSATPVPALVQAFGQHLMGRFVRLYPAMFARHGRAFDFLASIDNEIHVEVRKLYPQATLPRFDVLERDDDRLVLRYRSPRGMQTLALGLIEGLLDHYGEPCRVALRPDPEDGYRFELQRIVQPALA